MPNVDAQAMREILESMVLPGVVGVQVEALTETGAPATGAPDAYRICFQSSRSHLFIISQPTVMTRSFGIGGRELPASASSGYGWIVMEVDYGVSHLRGGILPGPLSAAVAAAEYARVLLSI